MAPIRIDMKRILCPVDFSEFSLRALERAAPLADWFDAEVVALHVIPFLTPPGPGLPYFPAPLQTTKEQEAQAERDLKDLVAPFVAEGVDVKTRVRRGDAWREILAEAEGLSADLVVMGTHGRSGFEHLLLGSVTEKVVRRATCPVLTVSNLPAPPRVGPLFRRVLCAADLTEASAHTIDFALALAEENQADVTLLHVIEELARPGLGGEALPGRARDRAPAPRPHRAGAGPPPWRRHERVSGLVRGPGAGGGRHGLARDPPRSGGDGRRPDRDGSSRPRTARSDALWLDLQPRDSSGRVPRAGRARNQGSPNGMRRAGGAVVGGRRRGASSGRQPMRTTMRYEGRAEAGSVLAEELRGLGLGPCVVAGIPREGLMVAARVAETLGAPLVAVHASKLYLPREPELPFGALAEDGHAVLDYRATVTLGLGESDIEEIKAAVAREMASRIASYPGPRLADYVPRDAVVIVDEGLATGLTMQAAIGYARRLGATAIVAAAPCASDRAAYEVGSLLSRSDDRLVCLVADPDFRAVSDYYRDFRPASDQQVAQLLAQHAPASTTPGRIAGAPAPAPGSASDTP